MESDATPFLIDANVYISFVDIDDPLHEEVIQIINKLRSSSSPLIFVDHVVQEILTVLLYAKKNNLVQKIVETIFNDPTIQIVDTPIHWVQEVISFAANQTFKPKMSFIDWLLLYRSVTTGIPILTFDKQLLSAHKKLS